MLNEICSLCGVRLINQIKLAFMSKEETDNLLSKIQAKLLKLGKRAKQKDKAHAELSKAPQLVSNKPAVQAFPKLEQLRRPSEKLAGLLRSKSDQVPQVSPRAIQRPILDANKVLMPPQKLEQSTQSERRVSQMIGDILGKKVSPRSIERPIINTNVVKADQQRQEVAAVPQRRVSQMIGNILGQPTQKSSNYKGAPFYKLQDFKSVRLETRPIEKTIDAAQTAQTLHQYNDPAALASQEAIKRTAIAVRKRKLEEQKAALQSELKRKVSQIEEDVAKQVMHLGLNSLNKRYQEEIAALQQDIAELKRKRTELLFRNRLVTYQPKKRVERVEPTSLSPRRISREAGVVSREQYVQRLQRLTREMRVLAQGES